MSLLTKMSQSNIRDIPSSAFVLFVAVQGGASDGFVKFALKIARAAVSATQLFEAH